MVLLPHHLVAPASVRRCEMASHRYSLSATRSLALRALGFWMREYRRVRRGEECGEELLLIAEAATSEAAR